jgi:hypothetical protein
VLFETQMQIKEDASCTVPDAWGPGVYPELVSRDPGVLEGATGLRDEDAEEEATGEDDSGGGDTPGLTAVDVVEGEADTAGFTAVDVVEGEVDTAGFDGMLV